MGDSNDPLTDAIKILESEPAKNLLSSPTKEIGELLGTVANLCRFYVTENLEKIFKKWAKYRRREHSLCGDDVRKVMPLFPMASMVSDEELQEKWVALMESTVKDDKCLPSFGQTLSQLTADEARFIDRIYQYVMGRNFQNTHELGGHSTLLGIYDERLRSVTYAEAQRLHRELSQGRLLIHDLERLGIIACRQEIKQPSLNGSSASAIASFLKELGKAKLNSVYSFTEYGLSFVHAVTPKELK